MGLFLADESENESLSKGDCVSNARWRTGGTHRNKHFVVAWGNPEVLRTLANEVGRGAGGDATRKDLDLAHGDTDPLCLHALFAKANLDRLGGNEMDWRAGGSDLRP